jgi:hypothetical protein
MNTVMKGTSKRKSEKELYRSKVDYTMLEWVLACQLAAIRYKHRREHAIIHAIIFSKPSLAISSSSVSFKSRNFIPSSRGTSPANSQPSRISYIVVKS